MTIPSSRDPHTLLALAAALHALGADIALRRLPDACGATLLVTLITHAVVATEESAQPLGAHLDLPPSQRELAGLLLAGRRLAEAAQALGIARRTAVDHLNGLIRVTGTRRQQDLLLHLSRAALG